jgi:hypothetical protein
MRIAPKLALVSLVAALAACGGGGGGGGDGGTTPYPMPAFDPMNFVSVVDNPYFPLVPGTKRTYEKVTDEGLEEVVVEVLFETKVILGVTCVVVRDTETLDGELVEDTRDWFAQDAQGNVWYLGEDTKEYEGGMVVSTEGSWEAGVDGAEAGILMLGDPSLAVGLTYPQESAPGVAEDMATVLSLAESVAVPYGAFASCLETEDFTPLEPGNVERKYYAPGVGLVLEVDEDGGRNELVSVE